MSLQDKFNENKDIIFAEPEWSIGSIRWLWDDDWYDGPMRGMIEAHGKRYYAHCFDITWHEIKAQRIHYKFFCIYELVPKRLEYQEYWQELHSLIMDIRENTPGDTDVYGSFYMGRSAADYEPLDLESGRDGKVVGWFIEGK